MKKITFESEYIAVAVIAVLSLFPWVGVLNQSGFDITMFVMKNITSVALMTHYAITISVLFAALALLLALARRANAIFPTISFLAAIFAFVYGMIKTGGGYFSSMQLAYLMVVFISMLMLLKKFGIIKIKF